MAIKTRVVGFQHGKLGVCLQGDWSCCSLGSVPAGAARCAGMGCKDKQTLPGLSCWGPLRSQRKDMRPAWGTAAWACEGGSLLLRELPLPWRPNREPVCFSAAWNDNIGAEIKCGLYPRRRSNRDVWCLGGARIVLQQTRTQGSPWEPETGGRRSPQTDSFWIQRKQEAHSWPQQKDGCQSVCQCSTQLKFQMRVSS